MSENWYVVRVRDNGACAIMTASTDFEESYHDYIHFTRMNPCNDYTIVHEKDLGKYFEIVRS